MMLTFTLDYGANTDINAENAFREHTMQAAAKCDCSPRTVLEKLQRTPRPVSWFNGVASRRG